MRRIYLDNAATSFPKPPAVYEAMLQYARTLGASPGRGQYFESREGARLIAQCRQRIARLINASSPESIIFTLNTTDALNLAIKGLWRAARMSGIARPRAVTTAIDHNSVLRPFQAIAEEGVELVHVPADPATGLVDPNEVAAAIRPGDLLLAVNMASNVTGTIQPAREITALARAAGIPCLLDGAQALGHISVDVRDLGCDLLAFPGHKGLLGPQGTGALYIRPGFEHRLATTREGGTGSWSEHDKHPLTMPERFEAGSHNTIGIAGLSEAVQWMLDRTIAAIREHEVALIRRFLEGLREAGVRNDAWPPRDGPCSSLRLLGPVDISRRVAVFAFTHDELEPSELAVILESRFGILARAGLSCAPRAHALLGTLERAGALRVSFGPFVTLDDIDYLLAALRAVCESSLVDVLPHAT
jgi:cysteine desulfurase/selenocysteine lyase